MTKLEEIAEAIQDAQGIPWEDGGLAWDTAQKCARAAVEALREPSEAMLRQAERMGDYGTGAGGVDDFMATSVWTDMIDAILNEKPE